MACQRCGSERVLYLNAKCSDLCNTVFVGHSRSGYPPTIPDICGNDYVELKVCLECGQTQGEFPKRAGVGSADEDD